MLFDLLIIILTESGSEGVVPPFGRKTFQEPQKGRQPECSLSDFAANGVGESCREAGRDRRHTKFTQCVSEPITRVPTESKVKF